MKIDLNADIGESYGVYKIGADEQILEYITSANIACGFHAGDPSIMRRTVHMALEKGVAIGAHPGFPDLHGFGRRFMQLSPEEVYDLTVYQIGALQAFAQAEGGRLHHVKPHGALYNIAAADSELADSICRAIYDVDQKLILYGLSGSELIKSGQRIGLKVANEAYSDRHYHSDGSLVSRSDGRSMIKNADDAADRLLKMIQSGKVTSVEGDEIPVAIDTVCLHGDNQDALTFAQTLHRKLNESGIRLQTI